MAKGKLEKKLEKPIEVLNSEIERGEGKEKTKKKRIGRDEIKDKSVLVILEKGRIFTYKGEDIVKYIDSLPEDYHVDYVIQNSDTVFINKDYRDIAYMVRYLLGNVYESLEMRSIKTNRLIGIIFFVIFIIATISNFLFINSGTYKRLESIEGKISEISIKNERVESSIDENDNSVQGYNESGTGEEIYVNPIIPLEIDKGSGRN